MRTWGYPKGGKSDKQLIMRSDGEASIIALKREVAELHKLECSFEQPPRGESRGNGLIEECGKTIREFDRIMKFQIEDRARTIVGTEDAIFPWICPMGSNDAVQSKERQIGKNSL